MKITVVGATGMTGSRVVTEATRRGHDVTAVSRGGTGVRADAHDRDRMAELFTGTDAVVAATRPAPGQEHTVTETISALLDAAAATRKRILVVGGAAPLRTPDDPDLLVLDSDFVPAQWRAIAAASLAQFETCQDHPADWTYLSPPVVLEPGSRTGTYRRGATTLLTAPDGTSRISAEDLAVAVVDELETPSTERHFTVAY